jgi:putative salt-induced outer membrane protein YdiY
MKKIIACNTAIALSALSLNALAQDPAGLTSVDQASSGSANVATTGFQSAQKPAEETTDFTRLTLGAGGMIARGNSQVQNYNALGDFGLRRGANQLAVKASLNQGSSGFVQASALTDKFQGVDLRLNIDPGIAIYAINEADHQWSFDVGYDFQYEDYRDEAIEPLTLHNARVATNYVNAVNESVTFKTGAEYLLALSPWEQCYWVTESSASIRANECDETKPNDAIEKVARVNWSLLAYARLDAKVSDKFAVQTALELRHDNSPVQLNYAMNDLRSSVNLTYQLF